LNETRKAACPTCGKPVQYEWRPFCSKRCREVDLGRWFNERYVVPTPIAPDEEDSVPDDGAN
jgi:endogenous inhibitor of DNA gyrase (YacG/DUF329 family)